MLHWLQLVSLANSAPSTSEQSIASMVQKEVAAQLRSSGVDRSRTPQRWQKPRGESSDSQRTKGEVAAHRTSTTCAPWSRHARTAHAKSELQGERQRQEAKSASTRRLSLASPRPSQRRHRGLEHAPPEPGKRCLLRFSRRQLPSRFLVHTPTRLHWMRRSTWVQPVSMLAEQARSSPLNLGAVVY